MESKRDAQKIESQLLNKFDYAWNKGSNGTRRPNDVLNKLEKLASSTPLFPSIIRKFQMLGQKPVGIRIKASKPFMQEDLSTYQDTSSLLPSVFKFGRSQPRLVSDRIGVAGNSNSTCGMTLSDGTICERPPVQGNKRCTDHRGMKKKSSFSKPVLEGKVAYSEGKCLVNEDFTLTCGVILDDGVPCRRIPTRGRKRCEEHKGMRIDFSISDSTKAKSHYNDAEYESKLQPETLSHYKSFPSKNYSITCGVDLGHGNFCRRLAVEGRQRCEEHKGMRISSLITRLATKEKSPISDVGLPLITSYSHSVTCGLTLGDGSFCKRQPVEGNKRCWQHRGMRVKCSSSSYSFGSEINVCGVLLRNGSVCSRAPAYGRKRCEQHKGMRVVS